MLLASFDGKGRASKLVSGLRTAAAYVWNCRVHSDPLATC